VVHPGIKRPAAQDAHAASGLKAGARIEADGVIGASGRNEQKTSHKAANFSHEETILAGRSFPKILVPGNVIGGEFGRSLTVIRLFWKIPGTRPQSASRLPLTSRANTEVFSIRSPSSCLCVQIGNH
jgi:hypothetical protein